MSAKVEKVLVILFRLLIAKTRWRSVGGQSRCSLVCPALDVCCPVPGTNSTALKPNPDPQSKPKPEPNVIVPSRISDQTVNFEPKKKRLSNATFETWERLSLSRPKTKQKTTIDACLSMPVCRLRACTSSCGWVLTLKRFSLNHHHSPFKACDITSSRLLMYPPVRSPSRQRFYDVSATPRRAQSRPKMPTVRCEGVRLHSGTTMNLLHKKFTSCNGCSRTFRVLDA